MKGYLKGRYFGCKICKFFYCGLVFGEREKSFLFIFFCIMKGISDKFFKFSFKKVEFKYFLSKGLCDIYVSVVLYKICYIRYVI